MNESGRIIQGFLFETQSEYEIALKEYEVVTYLKANTDFSNAKALYKLYEKLIEKESFQTVIGLQFLAEIREQIISRNDQFERILNPVKVKSKVEPKGKKSLPKVDNEKYKLLYEDMKAKKNRAYLVSGFLVAIIAGMIIITFNSNHASTAKLETALQNKYASWQEELNEREQTIEEREKNLDKK